MPEPLKPPANQAGPALLVAALHSLLLLGVARLPVWQEPEAAASTQPPLIVWLQGAPRQNPASPEAVPGPRRAQTKEPKQPVAAFAEAAISPARSPIRSPVRSPIVPQAITLPAPASLPASAPEIAAPDIAASRATLPAPPASAPLNLALPRDRLAPRRGQGAERSPALDDQRSNSARASLESRIAAALGGSDLITEFRLQDGGVRLQRGQACVVVRPSRDSTLDPFNATAQQRPRLVDRC